jgi:hypothetical protein
LLLAVEIILPQRTPRTQRKSKKMVKTKKFDYPKDVWLSSASPCVLCGEKWFT